MRRVKYLFLRIKNMDFKRMFNIINEIHKSTHKSRIYLFFDVIICGLKYQAGYVDYYIFEMWNLNSKERKTILTRGKNNIFVKYYNKKEFNHIFYNKDEFNEDSLFYLIMIYISENDYLNAQKYIDEIIEYKNEGIYYYSALFLKGQVIKALYGQNSCKDYYENTVGILRQGSLDYPDNLDLIIYRGIIYKELENYERALEMANYILAISDNIGEAYLLRAQIYEAMGDIEKSQSDKKLAVDKSEILNKFGI